VVTLPVEPIDYPAALAGQSNGRLASSILATVGPVTLLAATATRCWLAMVAAATDDGISLAPTSPADTYRTYAQQEALFLSRYQRDYEPGVTSDSSKLWNGVRWWRLADVATAAVPGTSNHGWGLAVDVAHATGARLEWLAVNAPRFGWSWEAGIVDSEPWHIRVTRGDNMPAAVLAYEQGDEMTPEQAAKLDEIHLVATTGKRAAVEAPRAAAHGTQTSGGGVPIAWLPKQFHEVDAAVAAIPTEPVQPAPVDPAALKAALLDPEVLRAIAQAVRDEIVAPDQQP